MTKELQDLAFLNSLSNEHSDPKPAEPKFKRCEKVITPSGEVCIIEDTHFENGSWLYLVGDPAQWIPESDLEPYTELEENVNLSQETANCDKHFDNIIKDSLSKERRLNIATTIIERIIKSEYYSLSEKYREDNIKEMVKVSLQITDAIMAECEKGGQDGEN